MADPIVARAVHDYIDLNNNAFDQALTAAERGVLESLLGTLPLSANEWKEPRQGNTGLRRDSVLSEQRAVISSALGGSWRKMAVVYGANASLLRRLEQLVHPDLAAQLCVRLAWGGIFTDILDPNRNLAELQDNLNEAYVAFRDTFLSWETTGEILKDKLRPLYSFFIQQDVPPKDATAALAICCFQLHVISLDDILNLSRLEIRRVELPFSVKVALTMPRTNSMCEIFITSGMDSKLARDEATRLFLNVGIVDMQQVGDALEGQHPSDWGLQIESLAVLLRSLTQNLARELQYGGLSPREASVTSTKIFVNTGALTVARLKRLTARQLQSCNLTKREMSAVPITCFRRFFGWLMCSRCYRTCNGATCNFETFRDFNTIARAVIIFINGVLGVVLAIVAGTTTPTAESSTLLRDLAIGFGSAVALLQLMLALALEAWIAAGTTGEKQETTWRDAIRSDDPQEIIASTNKLVIDAIKEMKRAHGLMPTGPGKDNFHAQIVKFEEAFGPLGTDPA